MPSFSTRPDERPVSSRRSSFIRRERAVASSPGSRSSSRGRTTSVAWEMQNGLRSSFFSSTDSLHSQTGAVGLVGNVYRKADIKRWDGNRRTTTSWDCLRKDPELWYPNGDCLVYFYGQGQSRRGPALRCSLAAIEMSNCRPLLEKACAYPVPDSPETPGSSHSAISLDSGYDTNPPTPGRYELYIPAPAHMDREEAFQYHLTTRNFFAWMFEKPLVGRRLSGSMKSLLARMNEFRPDEEENQDDMLAYLDQQGYTDFRECPDHALAVLQFAEKFEWQDLWTDAFVHCAGMNDQLILSDEFEFVSRTTKALITRAHLEMDLRLERAGKSLSAFLEDDLSGTYFGLGNEARKHLERFRSFLHSYYVIKYGYWPPMQHESVSAAFPNTTYRAMYFDFRSLYEYLLDPNSSISIQNNRPVEGGICVLQNVVEFDKRHKYTSLPHPLPKLPESTADMNRRKTSGLSKVFGSKQVKNDRRVAMLSALTAATNPDDIEVMQCSLVREYSRFERDWTLKDAEKIGVADARKVRWIVVYAILQTLISVTRIPKEVRDTEGVSYPLCCQIAGTPPWKIGVKTLQKRESKEPMRPKTSERAIEIKPDTNFLATQAMPLPTRPKSARKFSFALPLAAKSTPEIRAPQTRKPSYCEILVHGYGNGLNTVEADSDVSTPSSSSGEGGSSEWSVSSLSTDEGLPDMDHVSVHDTMNIYEDEGDVGLKLAKDGQRETHRSESREVFTLRESNPEVDRYVSS